MKWSQVRRVVPKEVLPELVWWDNNNTSDKDLTRGMMSALEGDIFHVQNELEHAPGKRKGAVIQTLNDIRNVILDELGVNQTHPDMSYPHVDRMRKKITV